MTKLLHTLVADQAQQRPDALALVMYQERLTYGQLDDASNRLARLLTEGGCQHGDRVCFVMPKSPAALISILGILKAGCIYVPMDPSSPAPRAAKIVEACAPRWILGTGPAVGLVDELLADARTAGSVSVGWMAAEKPAAQNFTVKFCADDLQSFPASPPECRSGPDDGAHILFTSGSTGIPKGVEITHANVLHFVDWAVPYFGIRPEDRNSGHSPLQFDLSTFDMFGTFAAGAQLHLVPPELNLMPNRLAEFIRASELTQWFSSPSILNYLAKFDAVRPGDFPSLKRLLWCGEVFPTPALIYWMKRLPKATFTNLYGPTEATVASSYYTVHACPTDDKAAIPIGTPCAGEELLVLDEQLQPVPPGEIGMLYIGGVGLSPGYWRDSEKTAGVFIPRPGSRDSRERIYRTGDLAKVGPDGLVYFIGRADTQIKSRGYRIELGEIETALNALDCLAECAVVAVNTGGFDGAAICCAYVPAPGAEVPATRLRQELSRVLPNYMLPARWMAFARLPKNSNGKIDRPKLREQFQQGAAKPAETAESTLVAH
jgi:amino acid adenylation domain-containing protein